MMSRRMRYISEVTKQVENGIEAVKCGFGDNNRGF